MRILKRMNPTDANLSYAPEQEITLDFPNAILDLHTFTFFYDFFAEYYQQFTTGNARTYHNPPRLAASIIDSIQIKLDGNVIQDIQEYGLLFNILNDLQNEKDDLDGIDTVLKHYIDANGDCKKQFISTQQTTDPTPYSLFISKFLGFIGEGDRYFDARTRNLSITIKLYPKEIMYYGVGVNPGNVASTNTNRNFKISNVFANIMIVDNWTGEMKSEFYFKDYSYTMGPLCNNNKNSCTTIKTRKKLMWMLGTFSPLNRKTFRNLQLQHMSNNTTSFGNVISVNPTNQGLLTELSYTYNQALDSKKSNLLNNSFFFKRDGRGIKTTQFRVNDSDVTPPMNMNEIYNETKRVLNNPMKRIVSIASFTCDFFANMFSYDENENEGFKKIDWIVEDSNILNKGGKPHLFICFQNSI
jgi:hypothetical protein